MVMPVDRPCIADCGCAFEQWRRLAIDRSIFAQASIAPTSDLSFREKEEVETHGRRVHLLGLHIWTAPSPMNHCFLLAGRPAVRLGRGPNVLRRSW
jgi:hypothetical protein